MIKFISKNIKILVLTIFMSIFYSYVNSQLLNFDIANLRKEWGRKDFMEANTAKFAFYMGRTQKRTILYMNLARQDGKKFRNLVIKPYILKNPNKKSFDVSLNSKKLHPLRPKFSLWLAALPHAIGSGIVGSSGHQLFIPRMYSTLHFNMIGENCSYGYFKGIDITLQLLNSPPHKKNILEPNFYHTGVSKSFHIKHGWNSVTTFYGSVYNNYTNANWFFSIGLQNNFNKTMIETSLGRKHGDSRISLGGQIYNNMGKTVFIPNIKTESFIFYFTTLGLNLQPSIYNKKPFVIIRPELSISLSNIYYFIYGIKNNKNSISIGYSYNIYTYKKLNAPHFLTSNPHTIELKLLRHFEFK